MVFEVPASKASQKQNVFEFQVPGEKKTRSLPLLKYTPIGYRNRLATLARPIQEAQKAGQDPNVDDLRELGTVQLEILERYSPGITDVMDDDQLAALLKAWQEASRISVGESPASAPS
jgi:hypothetical protein